MQYPDYKISIGGAEKKYKNNKNNKHDGKHGKKTVKHTNRQQQNQQQKQQKQQQNNTQKSLKIAHKKHQKLLEHAKKTNTPLLIERHKVMGGLPKSLPIAGKDFNVGPVSPVLVQQLRQEWQRPKLTILELAPGQEARREIITHIVGPEAIPFMERQSRFYYIDYLEQRIRGLRRYFIRDIGRTFGEIVDILLAAGIKVFLHGGIVRDIFTNTRSTDIDIVFDVGVPMIKKLCDREGWPCAQVMVQEQYINFGTDKGISLEGSHLRQSFAVPIHHHEATVNDLSYDMGNQVLVDFSGYGISDVIARRLRLTPLPKYWPRWAGDDFKKPLRFFKLIQKGYTPATPETMSFVVDYIREHMDDVYEKQFSERYPVSRIKHFLIKNITMGDINPETGEYTFGPNEDKLIPFLLTIKQYVGRPIFVRMLAHFTHDDLLRFKTAKVVTTMRGYLSSKEVADAHAELSASSGGVF
jgi:hypothetical protein